jgi:hypothetical protein
MSHHSITAEIEVKFHLPWMPDDEREVAYPTVEIVYSFTGGRPARIRYDENDHPAESDEVEVISATLITGDGLDPTKYQVLNWAQDWLADKGYDLACREARSDSEQEPPERERRED